METGKNKSSILKPQKPRNPLSDLNFIEPVKVESPENDVTTTTQRRSSIRRVSFASSNYVKKFATDPETQTVVWDTTYEERINKSDSTSDSSGAMHHNPSKKQSDTDIQYIQKERATVKIVESSNLLSAIICSEPTVEVNFIESQNSDKNDNRQSSINFYAEGGEDILTDSSLCNKNVIAVAQGLPSNTDNVPCSTGFTQPLKFDSAGKENISTLHNFEVNLPNLSHRRFCQFTTDEDYHYSTMEFTQQLPVVKNSINFTNKTILMDKSMELTKSLPLYNHPVVNVNSTNKTMNSVEVENMELTQHLPVIEYNSCQSNKTIIMNDSLELTKSLVVDTESHQLLNNDNKKRNYIEEQQLPVLNKCPGLSSNKTIIMNESLELTKSFLTEEPLVADTNNHQLLNTDNKTGNYVEQQLPVFNKYPGPSNNKTIMMNESLEFTKTLPRVDTKISPLLCKDNKTKSYIKEESSEFAQQLAAITNCRGPSNNTIMMDEGLECTKAVPTVDPLVVDLKNSPLLCKDNKTISSIKEENSEFPQQLPAITNCPGPSNNTIMMAEGLECTKAHPTVDPLVVDTKRSPLLCKDNKTKSYIKEENSKFAPQLPAITNCPGPSNNSIMMDEDLECTKALPTVDPLLCKGTKRRRFIEEENIKLPQQLSLFVSSPGPTSKTSKMEESLTAKKSLPFLQEENKEFIKQFPEIIVNSSDSSNKTTKLEEYIQPTRGETQTNENLQGKTACANNPDLNSCSFHTPNRMVKTYMPFSPGVDDTQHLINCSVGDRQSKSDFSKIITGDLSPSFLSVKYMQLSEFGNEAFPVSLESDPSDLYPSFLSPKHMQLSQMNQPVANPEEQTDDEVFASATAAATNSPEAIPNLKRRSLEDLECPSDSKKQMYDSHEHNTGDEVNKVENISLVNISQENLTLADTVTSVNDTLIGEVNSMVSANNSLMREVPELIFNLTQNIVNASMNKISIDNKKHEETYRRRTLLKQRIENFSENITKSLDIMMQKSAILLELFNEEIKEISLPFEIPTFEDVKCDDCSTDFSFEPESPLVEIDQYYNNSTSEMEEVLTIKEKIEEKQKRCKGYWVLLALEDDNCKFNTLYKSIEFTVQFDKTTGIVNKIFICYDLKDTAKHTSAFVHKILKDRLSEKNIQSAVGEHYDILTLLDYVYLNMEKMLDILGEFRSFDKKFNMKMDENFRVTFKMVILEIRSTWLITVDLSDIENITEDSVTAFAKIGTVNESEIKSLVKSCPKGLLFLNNFVDNLRGYIQLLKKRANLKKN